MNYISEKKPGKDIEHDFQRFNRGKAVIKSEFTTKIKIPDPEKEFITSTNVEKTDIGQLVSNDLSDMFGVFEFECYYPVKNLVIENKKIFNLKQNVSIDTLLELTSKNINDLNIYIFKNMWDSFFAFIISSLQKENLKHFNKVSKNPDPNKTEIPFSIKTITQISNKIAEEQRKRTRITTSTKMCILAIKKLLGNDKFLELEDMWIETLGNPIFADIINKNQLKDYAIIDDYIVIKPSPEEIRKHINKYIAIDLKKQFNDSLFQTDKIITDLSKEQDAELDGRVWNVTTDGSLLDHFKGFEPVEIVSRRLSFREIEPALNFMANLFKKLDIKTTTKTGLHLNVGFNKTKDVDLLKIVLLTDDRRELQLFDRAENTFCESQIKRLTETDVLSSTNQRATAILFDQLKQFHSVNFYSLADTSKKYKAVNFKKWVNPFPKLKPVIENRIMGGKDYLDPVSIVLNRTKRFFYTVSVAGNPELYKRQYISLLEKVKNLANQNSGLNDLQDQDERETLAYLEYEFKNLERLVKFWKNNSNFENNEQNLNEFRRQILTIINIKNAKFNKKGVLFTKFTSFIKNILPVIKSIYEIPELENELSKIKSELTTKQLYAFNTLFFKPKTTF